MENQGGASSAAGHFEKLIFGDDMMTPDSSMDTRFGIMTLAMAKDSGWYDVDLSKAEEFFWGKDEGCDMFDVHCNKQEVSEFCLVHGHRGCSDDHMYSTICSYNPFSDGCSLKLNIKNCKKHHTAENNAFTYGPDSVCLSMKVFPELD
jgi:hypothetical protein